MKKINIVFMGTPLFATPILQSLIQHYHVSLVVSQPDRKRDRQGHLLATPTKKMAIDYQIPIYQPLSIKDDYQKVLDMKPDIIITCAYGQMIPNSILSYPKYGCINIHASLLPKLRGGAPIQRAIISGEEKTGITIMYMESKMDAGDIISQKEILISEEDTLDTLSSKLSILAKELLLETLPKIIQKTNERKKQEISQVTYGYNITKEETQIDFHKKMVEVNNLIRGLSSTPGAYCLLDNKRIKVYQSLRTNQRSQGLPGKIIAIDKSGIYVNTKDYVIKLTELQLEGKKRSLVASFINGIDIDKYLGKVINK